MALSAENHEFLVELRELTPPGADRRKVEFPVSLQNIQASTTTAPNLLAHLVEGSRISISASLAEQLGLAEQPASQVELIVRGDRSRFAVISAEVETVSNIGLIQIGLDALRLYFETVELQGEMLRLDRPRPETTVVFQIK